MVLPTAFRSLPFSPHWKAAATGAVLPALTSFSKHGMGPGSTPIIIRMQWAQFPGRGNNKKRGVTAAFSQGLIASRLRLRLRLQPGIRIRTRARLAGRRHRRGARRGRLEYRLAVGLLA